MFKTIMQLRVVLEKYVIIVMLFWQLMPLFFFTVIEGN